MPAARGYTAEFPPVDDLLEIHIFNLTSKVRPELGGIKMSDKVSTANTILQAFEKSLGSVANGGDRSKSCYNYPFHALFEFFSSTAPATRSGGIEALALWKI